MSSRYAPYGLGYPYDTWYLQRVTLSYYKVNLQKVSKFEL